MNSARESRQRLIPGSAVGLVLIALVLLPVRLAAIDQVDALHDSCSSLSNQDEVAKCYCNASAKKPKNAEWKKECDESTAELGRYVQKYHRIFVSAEGLLEAHRFDDARKEFIRIPFGPDYEKAQYYLRTGIEERRKAYDDQVKREQTDMANRRQQAEDDKAFKEGSSAFTTGDYDKAAQLFSGISSAFPSKNAVDEKRKIINDYRFKLKSAEQYEGQKLFENAKQSYLEAAAMSSGAAREYAQNKANDMNTKIEAIRLPPAPQVTPSQQTAGTPAVITTNKPLPPRPVEHPALNPANLDTFLNDGIRNYYKGNLQAIVQAEALLQDYINANGPKKGLALFYLGASSLTHMYLLDPKLQKERIEYQQLATESFRKAKQVEGFSAPEKFVSPKIFQEYRRAG